MEKRVFKTFVSNKANEYIRARINGILAAFCDDDPTWGYATWVYKTGDLMRNECTDEQYLKAKEFIEKNYPGVCIFDDNIL